MASALLLKDEDKWWFVREVHDGEVLDVVREDFVFRELLDLVVNESWRRNTSVFERIRHREEPFNREVVLLTIRADEVVHRLLPEKSRE